MGSRTKSAAIRIRNDEDNNGGYGNCHERSGRQTEGWHGVFSYRCTGVPTGRDLEAVRSSFAAWYLRRISARSSRVGGSFKPISSIVLAMICETARLRNHLWLDGITYQGARFVLVSAMASS